MNLASPLLIVLRLAWASLPVTAGPLFEAALEDLSREVRLTGAATLWVGWGGGVLAVLVLAPVTLTISRLLLAGAVTLVVGAAVVAETSALAPGVGVVAVFVGAVASFAPETAIHFVNGPAYPNERRFPLRVPVALIAGPLPLASMITIGAPMASVLMLASGEWALGLVTLVIGLPVAALLGRAIHGLARRWVVFVPAGIVVHDPLTLVDPVLFPRAAIASFGAAPDTAPGAVANDTRADLRRGAVGLAVELQTTEPAQIARLHPGRRAGDPITVTSVVFAPTRPGRVLAEAERRRFAKDS